VNASPARYLYPIALAHFTIELCNNFLPILYPVFITTMGLTYSQVGVAALIAGSGASLAQPLFGYVSDRFGSRRLVALSMIWTGVLMGLVGLVSDYVTLLVVIGLGAFGSAAFHPAGASTAGSIPGAKRGASLSVFAVGGSLGVALSPLLITVAVGWFGLRGTLVVLPIGLVAGAFVHRQLRWKEPGVVAPAGTRVTQPASQSPSGSLLALVLIVLMVMTQSWYHFSLVTYLPEWLQSQGWSAMASGQMFTLLVVSVAVGSMFSGALSDRVGRWRVLLLTMGFLAPALWLFLSMTGPIQIVILGGIGVMLGGCFPVAIAAAQEAWPSSIGVASALVTGLGWVPGGVGASFTGFMADRTSLTSALYLLLIAPLVGLVCALIYANQQWSAGRRPISPRLPE